MVENFEWKLWWEGYISSLLYMSVIRLTAGGGIELIDNVLLGPLEMYRALYLSSSGVPGSILVSLNICCHFCFIISTIWRFMCLFSLTMQMVDAIVFHLWLRTLPCVDSQAH